MNKQEAMKEIETIRARLEVLEGIVQEPWQCGLWKPKVGERYWLVDSYGSLFPTGDTGLISALVTFGNFFPTREAAEKAAPLFARAHKIIQAALMVDPDAGGFNKSSRVWTAVFSSRRGKWEAMEIDRSIQCVAFVHTEEQAERMAAILNAEGV